jgi:hypothetical protein
MMYTGPSLQDLLMQQQSFAPDPTMGTQIAALPQSAYSTVAAQDPTFVPRATDAMGRLVNSPVPDPRSLQPQDMAYGRASSFYRGNQGEPDDEMSVMDKVKSVIGLPFGLLAEGRNAVQDVLHLPGAQQRERSASMVAAIKNLSPYEKQLLGVAGIEGIDTPSQGGDIGTAKGQPSSLGANAQEGASQKGFFQWAQNLGRDANQQRMNEIGAAIRTNMMLGKISQQQAETMMRLAQAKSAYSHSGLYDAQAAEVHPTAEAHRGLLAGQTAQAYAGANQNNAGAAANMALANQRNTLTPALASGAWGTATGNWAEADKKQADAQHAWEYGGPLMDQSLAKGAAEVTKLGAETERAQAQTEMQRAKTNAVGQPSALDKVKAYNAANTTAEKNYLLDELKIPNKEANTWGNLWAGLTGGTKERVPLRPEEEPAPAQTSPVRPDGAAINAVYRLLKTADPAGNEGTLMQRAQEIAAINPQLDRSSEDAFLDSAEKFGLSDREIIALWNGNK